MAKEELVEIGEYWNRPACELIFLTKVQHKTVHNMGNSWFKGRKMTKR